ncbi:hypothetical protein GOP47_0021858 [Adiantum capillus-veneris]|uniref:Uncharacterized protein n=1 Tax=Adiantum capillus-veneris TaxID=13818 RepID=A0A9D4Z888_ADICA|nr:hypothetical protein GOP47_0021858 [Adiantum capillus-veneris]
MVGMIAKVNATVDIFAEVTDLMTMAELYTGGKVTEQCKEDLGADSSKIVRRSTRPIPKVVDEGDNG